MKLLVPPGRISVLTGHSGAKLLDHQLRKARLVELVRANVSDRARVMDAGCGCGDAAVELALLGYDVTAVDMMEERIRRGRQLAGEMGVNVDFSVGDAMKLAGKPYDAVLLGEIIEHFHEPEAFLNSLVPLVKDDGCIVLSTPNMPTVRNRIKFGLFGVFPDNFPQHKAYFDKRRFHEMVDRTGWRIIYFKTRFGKLFENPPAWFARVDRTVMAALNALVGNSGTIIFAVLVKR